MPRLLGSPPHTWRKLCIIVFIFKALRITSTYVEKTYHTGRTKACNQDHLHIRGENLLLTPLIEVQSGSPPHTWRKQYLHAKGMLNSGITSTYVEKTYTRNKVANFFQDHLHIRGENKTSCKKTGIRLGSPPHTWRKLMDYVTLVRLTRITSTYVEKTTNDYQYLRYVWDHLHIRGENAFSAPRLRLGIGSPPHTWRKHHTEPNFGNDYRITSTYVEKTEPF